MDRETVHRRRWVILAVLITSLLIVVLDHSILNVALRVISDPNEGLGASQSQLAWAINSYSLVFAGMLFTCGVIGDRVGRKRMLMFGLALFGLASLVSAYAQSPEQLILARAFMGLGGAAVMPQTLAIITNVFSAEERGRAIGVWAGAVGLALGIGPPLGGLLLANFWWGSVFLINVPIVGIGLVLLAVLVPESRNETPGRLDPAGVLLSIVGLVLLAYGIIRAGEQSSLASPGVYGSILGGLAVLIVFVLHEARTENPALNVRLFRSARLSVAIVTIMMMFFAMSGVLFFMNFYWQSVREFSPLQAGLLVLPLAVAQLVVAPLAPHLVARFGPRLIATVGILLASGALGSYAFLDTNTPVWMIEVAFFVQGTGMAMVMPPATESIMASVPREQAGAASAVQNTVRQVSTAMGVAVLGALISMVYRSGIDPHLAGLPAGMRRSGGESIEGTMAVARRLGEEGTALVAPAKEAFLSGMHLAALCSFVTGMVCMVIVLIWLPRRNPRPEDQDASHQEDGQREAEGAAGREARRNRQEAIPTGRRK
ncbi:DHA2 family integral membrane protein (MFS transporter) [Lipingzhangella halophila]|uniref:DHA2 family integral membrane protein (MFS transporter) n=1 Tax=Lipingzhangella halophila TaxID=1783352 RepID=A0A7W7W1L4_9ACTN|nr:MFS transporter [Lipingzhangella halophila]MBB4930781.1 DHA2 family integral membrane protein (MFS transporter) [Lipingzhangella halophila]